MTGTIALPLLQSPAIDEILYITIPWRVLLSFESVWVMLLIFPLPVPRINEVSPETLQLNVAPTVGEDTLMFVVPPLQKAVLPGVTFSVLLAGFTVTVNRLAKPLQVGPPSEVFTKLGTTVKVATLSVLPLELVPMKLPIDPVPVEMGRPMVRLLFVQL